MTDVKKCDYVFTWKIKNYSCCLLKKGEYLESPVFTLKNLSDIEWTLKFYPIGDVTLKSDEEFVSCFLNFKPQKDTIKAIVSYSLEIVSEKERILTVTNDVNKEFGEDERSKGCSKFFAISDLEKEMDSWEEDVLTIRCCIKCSEQSEQKNIEATACTDLTPEEYCIDWHVKVPALFEYSEYIDFEILDLYYCTITLDFKSERLMILIEFEEDNLPEQVTVKISLFDKIGGKLGSKRAVHIYENAEAWTFPDFITYKLLQNCKYDSLHYDFKLKFDILIPTKEPFSGSTHELKFVSIPTVSFITSENPVSAMQNNYQSIFLNKNYSDVKLRCDDDEFPAHKLVLSVWSPVFAAMFNQEMTEKETGVVDIPDIAAKTLKVFLEFLYTETMDEINYDIAKNVILVADKYQVQALIGKCALFLRSVITVDNVCEIVSLADLINCENLKSCAIRFIITHASKVLPTSAWSKLIKGNVDLATDILAKLTAAICN